MRGFGSQSSARVSSRREREEICFSKRVTFEFRDVFVSWPLRQLVPLLVQKSRRSGDCNTVSWLVRAPGFVRLPPMSQPLGLRSIWISNQPCRPSAMVADRSLSSGFSACHLTVMVLALLRSWDRSLIERNPRTSPPQHRKFGAKHISSPFSFRRERATSLGDRPTWSPPH